MGLYKNCYTTVGDAVEVAVLGLYDEAQARSVDPGFDDTLGEPYLEDADDDGLGERVRPETVVEVNAKAEWVRHEEQDQDGVGNAPRSLLMLTVFAEQLAAAGLLAAGVVSIRPNDRLLRLQNAAGAVRVDFEQDGRDGLHCFEVRPGETGTRKFTILFENRRPVER